MFPKIKQDLRKLLVQLKDEGRVSVYFDEYNELTDVMYEVYQESIYKEADADTYLLEVSERCKERINLLLDVYGYAKQQKDKQWMDQLMSRLSQLTFTPAEAT
ncbi:hypothetical protein [Paenibacillus pinistramenti]|uniref:hypothetical protein n=1 Tax=Paenibacillus pinistramenti TaxID=1768003 RepID=UPI001EEFD6BB|nr:hypothetical protein [Paenibacillus pinistramenti]